jgi:hypothetical protein
MFESLSSTEDYQARATRVTAETALTMRPAPGKVSGQTRTEVNDKLKVLHSELDAGAPKCWG